MRNFFATILILVCGIANANTFVVSNTNDSGVGSLREAITSTNTIMGADTIIFNIPIEDAGYNSTSGTWLISLQSVLPYFLDSNLFIDGSSQPGYSGSPKIAITTSSPTSVLWAFGVFSSDNKIKGIQIYGFVNGILLSEPSGTNNTIEFCYIGTNHNGTSSMPNTNGIVINNNSNGNFITNNIISGNTANGIVIKRSNNTSIKGNKIGCDFNGINSIPNENGITADSSSNNIIGGQLSSERNLISGNSQSGILITGRASTNNIIQGNYIGTDITGEEKLSNLYGVTITKSKGNIVGPSNLISGNIDIGVLMTGKYTRENVVKGNLIGTNVSGTQLLDNHKGVVIKSLANKNKIGGSTTVDRNIISGNLEIGIYIEAADSNLVVGNYIGTDITGMNKVAVEYTQPYYEHLDSLVQGNGIEFNATAKHNILGGDEFGERNIVSGHKVYGVVYYGNCSYNHLYNNFIGTDVTSQNPIPNATGICFDCASNHNDVVNCVISGNLSYGLFYVTRGTEYNRFWGNMVGVDSTGTLAVPNDIGIVVSTGTAHNIIGGDEPWQANVFSGNRLSGMMITNGLTEYNQVKGNYFGTDKTGTVAIPNLYGITITTFTKHNNIEDNLISGNTMSGIILYENADSNRIVKNLIGTDINLNPLGNGNGGIYIDQGASYNMIGDYENPNLIAYNSDAGILVKHQLTKFNRISGNKIYNNEGLGIDIYPFGMVNENDNGDWDDGPAELMNYPEINAVIYNPETENSEVTGILAAQYPASCTVEIYKATQDDGDYGQGIEYVGYATPDNYGNWQLNTDALDQNDIVTSLAIDQYGNTSEFSLNFDDIILSIDDNYAIDQVNIGPVPASDFLNINLPASDFGEYEVNIFDVNGRLILTKQDCYGDSFIDLHNKSVFTSGKYIIHLKSSKGLCVSKSIVIVK
jgi:titin